MLCAMNCEIASSIYGYSVHVNIYCTCIVPCTELHLVYKVLVAITLAQQRKALMV